MTTVDSLDIQIQASAQKASESIEKLVDKLSILADSLGKINGSAITGLAQSADLLAKSVKNVDAGKLSGIASGMQRLSDAAVGFKDAKSEEITSLAGALKGFDGIDTNSLYGISSSMKSLAEGVKAAQGIDTSGFLDIVSSISKLGGVKATVGTENLIKIKDDLAKFVDGMNGIGSLTFDVQSLSNLLSAINRLGSQASGNAAKNLSPISAQLQNLVRQLNNIGSLNFDTANLSNLVNAISRMGGKGVKNAIDNIPKLAVAMKDLMQTLYDAPRVSQNLIDMTNALANFTQQGSKVSVVSGTITGGLNRTSGAMDKAKKSSMSLAVAFGKFYASYFLVIRGIKKLWGSIESSFNYLEVLNYFDAAFGQVAANADLSAFEEMGYESADAYYGSFAKRAEEVTRKMSGFTIGENGLLQSTGAVSLGLDPSQLMNYQAMFGQMSSSMGVASETSLKLSQALTEIGADLASVKNMEFEDVWRDMASGLAGMSRTLDKYGVNIRNVNLQQKLMELGIDANIQSLNQNDKALLRAIILLENTKYAWGDLADTINQPANQLRLIQANFQNLSRTIGNLFLPVVQKVLPYVNALVIAVQRLFSWLGNLIGIDISGISTAIGSADMGDILDQTDDLASGLGAAEKAAKKMKTQLLGIDELNIISPEEPDTGAGGGGGGIGGGLLDTAFEDAFSKYQQAWDEAFGNLENRAQEIADKIEKAFDPLKKIIQDFAIGDFFQAGKDTAALVTGIFDFFADAIDKVDWNGIGKKIGDFFAGIDWFAILKSVGNLIWQALKAAFELYVGAFSSAPLETALVSLVAFPGLLKAITSSKLITGIGKLWKNFKVWGDKIKLVTATLIGNKDSVSDLVTAYPKLSKKVDTVKTAFSNFFSSVKNNGFWKTVDGGITNIRNSLGGLQKAAIVAVAGFAEFSVVSNSVEKLTLGTENWLAEIGKIAGVAAAAGAAMYVALGPAGLAIAGITGVVAAIKGINDAFDTIQAEAIGNAIKDAMSNPGGVAIEDLANGISDSFSNAANGFSELNTKSSELTTVNGNIKSVVDEIDRIKRAMDLGVESVEGGKERINTALGSLVELTTQKMGLLTTTLLNLYGEGGALSHAYGETEYSAEQLTDAIIRAQYATNEAAQSIYEQMQNVEFGSTEWYNLYIQLQNNTRGMEEFEEAAFIFSDNINKAAKGIDWKALLGENGELNETYLKEILGNVSTSLDEYTKVLNESEQQTKLYWNEMLTKAATPEDKAIFQSELENVEKQFENMRVAAQNQVTQFTNMLQTDYIAKTADVISEADKEWTGAFGQGNEGTFIKKAVDIHYEEFGKLQSAITTSFSNLKDTGVTEAKETMESIYGALFEEDLTGSFTRDLFNTEYKLREGWQQVLENAGFPEVSKEYAINTVKGFAEGIETFTSNSETAAEIWMGKVFSAIHDSVMDFGSPSKATKQFGKDTIEGYNIGIESNTERTVNAIGKYTTIILGKFSEVIAPLKQVGINAMQGLIEGMSSMEPALYQKTEEIANNMERTIKNALEIHSPSRVMFKLGDFTMQGFGKGLESGFNPILSSLKEFSFDLQNAPIPSFGYETGGYEYTLPSYEPESGIMEYRADSFSARDIMETNALLRRQNELLQELLEKDTSITIGNRDIYKAAYDGAKEYGRRIIK